MLPAFDSDVAWELGTIIRTCLQRKHERPAVVYIALANSTQLFFATSRPGTPPDNMHWVKRKEAVVLRCCMSSLRMVKRAQRGDLPESLKDLFQMADPSVYAFHGGGFPVRVKNVEGIVGVIVVDGLTQEVDHGVIIECIQEYLTTNNLKYLK